MAFKPFLCIEIILRWHRRPQAECNYGGRITDDNDRHLLGCLLSRHYCPEVADTVGHLLSPSGTYAVPADTTLAGCQAAVAGLPDSVMPEAVGLPDNSAMTRNWRDSRQLLEGVLATQPQVEVGDQERGREGIMEQVVGYLKKVPAQLATDELAEKFPIDYGESLNTVLRLEVSRYNSLVRIVQASLSDLVSALKGEIIMSQEVEETLESVLERRVPIAWLRQSYPSLRTLAGYIADLAARVDFFNGWIEAGIPASFWLPGFYFPQSFLSAIQQNFARKNKTTVDHVGLAFSVLADGETTSGVVDGYVIYGVQLEGARWDRERQELAECLPRQHYSHLPPVLVRVVRREEEGVLGESLYRCPVYQTQGRRGDLTTSGHSTNFIFYIYLPTSQEPTHWTVRGVAAVCQVD